MKYGGWAGTVLRVDLSNKKISKAPLSKDMALNFIGGRGFGSKVLYDEVGPEVEPLSPENRLIFSVSPLTGTLVPASCRWTVTAKGPESGAQGDGNAGGFFGPELKFAGYDQVIFQGRAEKPVYLWISDDDVELMDAGHVWGKDLYETNDIIKRDLGDPLVRVAAIGPSGENLVKSAGILGDYCRMAGKGGIGAVMGSKNLKAVAVRGTKQVKVADPEKLEKLVKEFTEYKMKDPETKAMAAYGSVRGQIEGIRAGIRPAKNFSAKMENYEEYEPEYIRKNFWVTDKSCFSCPINCDHLFVIGEGSFAGTYGWSVQSATFSQIGTNLGNPDSRSIIAGHALVDRLGLHMICAGVTLAWAIECYEKGLITREDTDGLELRWGDWETYRKMMEKMAYREGFGNLLAEGVKKASENIGKGSEKFAIHVKGVEGVAQDPRHRFDWGLAVAVATRGADHMRGAPNELRDWPPQEIIKAFGRLMPRTLHTIEGKGPLVKWNEDQKAIENCLEMCVGKVGRQWELVPMYKEYFNAVTGLNYSEEDLWTVGERVCNIEKAFNVKCGLSRKDDTLPERWLKEPYPVPSPAYGFVCDLEPMLDEYYEVRGWDKETSWPTRAKLESLKLKYVADELQKMDKLPPNKRV